MSGANLPPLKTRKLGRTNASVTELGLGAAPLAELFETVEDEEAADLA
jgi:D-threo-aldose 1-dehydrogenase